MHNRLKKLGNPKKHVRQILEHNKQGRIEGGFLRFQETPFDSPIILKQPSLPKEAYS